jgi:hypothetical protein
MKLNRGQPQPMPDFRKEMWMKWIQAVNDSINKGERITHLIDQLKTGIGIGDFSPLNIDLNPMIAALTDFDNAVISNSPEGWKKTRNRRTAIYTKLVNRYMSDEWDIDISGDWFYLTRKNREQSSAPSDTVR